MPAVPLPHPHGVGVDLLVQLVQQPHRLHDHGVHLVRTEFQFVARHAVRQSQTRRPHVRGRQRGGEEGVGVAAHPAEQLVGAGVLETGHGQFLADGGAQSFVLDGEAVGKLRRVFLQQRFKRFRQLALQSGGGGGDRLGRVAETLKGHEFQRVESLLFRRKEGVVDRGGGGGVFHTDGFERFLRVGQFEQTVAARRLVQHQHDPEDS
mmetsp:Transcript_21580/g.49060  ORF Transcript_21580/g.49060 Transcript_21580/m.49060 type:complete len:207 (+) Transcript_21580:1122-1742(+)